MEKLRWNISYKEVLFQITLLVIVFLFYSFDRNAPGFKFHQFIFFFTYVIAAFLIGFLLMPRFLYQKKYVAFSVAVIIIVFALIFLEELVLEPWLFAGTRRANNFSGIVFSLMGVMPILTVLCGFKFAWDALQKQQQIEKLEGIIKESELQFLRSQINPHFLFNNLNNLYSYAIEGSEKTPKIILELSGLLRYMLYECKESYVPLTKELEQLKNFIGLSQLQIEDRGVITFNEQLDENHHKIAPLILMVFIENAFKHSQAGLANEIKIGIDLTVKDGILLFTCENNHAAAEKIPGVSHGIGLENVRKRLQLIYPNAHQLTILHEAARFKVDLSITL